MHVGILFSSEMEYKLKLNFYLHRIGFKRVEQDDRSYKAILNDVSSLRVIILRYNSLKTSTAIRTFNVYYMCRFQYYYIARKSQ